MDLFFYVTLERSYINFLSLTSIKEVVAQIAFAVNTLHKNGVVHRDIKIENFLVFGSDPDPHVLLWDLDTLTNVTEQGQPIKKDICHFGTPKNIAPEVAETYQCKVTKEIKILKFKENYSALDLKAVDAYAVGVVLHNIWSQFYELYPRNDFDELVKLFAGLKENDPRKRLTMQQVLESPWFGKTAADRETFFSALQKNFQLDLLTQNALRFAMITI